jgi:hypothetical protein
MNMITRGDLGIILESTTPTRTIKSDYLTKTIFEEWEITDDWLVCYLGVDENGVLNIGCVPTEYGNA